MLNPSFAENWFQHDLYSLSDTNVQLMVTDLGPAGYGIFWAAVEKLYQNGEHGLSDRDITVLARQLGASRDEIVKAMDVMVDNDLFLRGANGRYYSRRVSSTLEEKAVARQEWLAQKAEAGKASWKARKAKTTQQAQNERSLNAGERSLNARERITSVTSVTSQTSQQSQTSGESQTSVPSTFLARSSSDDSSEPAADAPQKDDPVIASIPLSGNGSKVFDVTKSFADSFHATYPGVDVEAECRKMAKWCETNPTRRKTERGIRAFVNNWLNKAQNEASGRILPQSRQGSGQRRFVAPDVTPDYNFDESRIIGGGAR